MLALVEITPWHWVGFIACVLVFLALDLGLFHRHAHKVKFKEALLWTAVWFSLAMVFASVLKPLRGQKESLEFVTGYLIELSLSMDNVFVIALIFSYFHIPDQYQHRVLFWGIVGALIMRGLMIGVGVALILWLHWILYVMGAFVLFSGMLKRTAVKLSKICNDLRLLSSGPRTGINEINLPARQPGSSIMPGKVNPTQVEALTMVCAQVMGHDVAIGFAASQGHFELNVYKPLIVLDTLDSVRLLADAMHSFAQHCVAGISVNAARVEELLQSSLMLVTALTPHIGYDRSAQIAKHAHTHGSTLRAAALALGAVSAEQFDAWVVADQMLGPRVKSL